MKLFRIIDKVFRYFGYCLIAKVNTDTWHIEDIFIEKTFNK